MVPSRLFPSLSLTEEGKKKKVLDKHIYHWECALFADYVSKRVPPKRWHFPRIFEHAVFNRAKLNKVLNHEGSTLMKGAE